jgi:hypothetical protein
MKPRFQTLGTNGNTHKVRPTALCGIAFDFLSADDYYGQMDK